MKSWRTTTLGVFAILFGLWLAHVTYVPSNTLKFNVIYVWPSSIALVLAGIGLVHARDHKFKDQ
jgi:hypothetical protein